jgi:hypothetical protein
MSGRIGFAIVLCACSYDPGTAPGDSGNAPTMDGGQADTITADAYDVTMLGPFGTPTIVAALAGAGVDDDPTVTGDLCELFYSATRAAQEDIYVSLRATPSDPWGAPARVAELSSASADMTPEVSADGLTIYLTRNNDILRATRATRSAAWSAPALVAELNSPQLGGSSAPSADEQSMVLASARAGTIDVWLATRSSLSDVWSAPAPVAELNTTKLDTTPYLATTHGYLIYASDRVSTLPRLYRSWRMGGVFGAPEEITELNGAGSTMDPWISEDLRYVMFASDRSGDWEVYEAKR